MAPIHDRSWERLCPGGHVVVAAVLVDTLCEILRWARERGLAPALTEVGAARSSLKELHDINPDFLLGTGYDSQQLAALVMITRHKSEIPDFDAAQEWVGMPSYDVGGDVIELHLKFETLEAREEATKLLGLNEASILKKDGTHRNLWSSRWPDQERDDLSVVEVEA